MEQKFSKKEKLYLDYLFFNPDLLDDNEEEIKKYLKSKGYDLEKFEKEKENLKKSLLEKLWKK